VGNQLDLSSQKILLEIPTKRSGTNHEAGSLAFGDRRSPSERDSEDQLLMAIDRVHAMQHHIAPASSSANDDERRPHREEHDIVADVSLFLALEEWRL
jgi:hypothetical protein